MRTVMYTCDKCNTVMDMAKSGVWLIHVARVEGLKSGPSHERAHWCLVCVRDAGLHVEEDLLGPMGDGG